MRQRVLSDDEVRHLWAVCGQAGDYGGYMQMLLLTACRRSEIAGLRWGEIDPERRTLTIPADALQDRPRAAVPLSPLAERVLEGLPRWPDGDFVFTTTGGRRPFGSHGWLKQSSTPSSRPTAQAQGVEPFTFDLHDLRRTVRTGLSELRVPPHVAEFVPGPRRERRADALRPVVLPGRETRSVRGPGGQDRAAGQK